MEKTKKYLCVCLLAVLAGCNLLENDLPGGKPRLYYERSDNKADSVNNIKSPEEPVLLKEIFDTTVFVSAVRCGPGYDWQRDTAYGRASAQLLLYRNGEVVLSIPAGDGTSVSVAPDMHHIIGGHLYTEYCDYSQTVIGCDGETLFRFPGRELLKGLLVRDGSVYTLTENLSKGGVVFRRDGVEVFSKERAKAFGGFDEPSYGEGGALYEDAGSICFAYKYQAACYIVRDGGAPSPVSAEAATDAKSVGGKNVAVGANALGYNWKDARIWRIGESYLVSGESAGEKGVFRAVSETDGRVVTFWMGNAVIYCSKQTRKALDMDKMTDESFCFSPRCATLVGADLAVLYTPRDGGTPYMSLGLKKTMFEGLDGYLTGMTATVSRTSTLPLTPRPR